MKALLIGGGGTLGEYSALELLKKGWSVDVLAPEELTSQNRNLRYFRGLGTDENLAKIFAENTYDVVVDYIYYRCALDEWKKRADWLLARTGQLVYLSSYRVYAGSQGETPITEESPLLWDVAPQSFRDQDIYAGPKTQAERYLQSLERKNWTIVRPLISFSHYRLDLLLTGGDQLVIEAVLPDGGRRLGRERRQDVCRSGGQLVRARRGLYVRHGRAPHVGRGRGLLRGRAQGEVHLGAGRGLREVRDA